MPKVKSCESCALCQRLYGKGGYGYYVLDGYLCAVTESFTDKKSVCERWQKKVPEYDISAERFDKAEEDISAIKQFFKEKKIHLVTLRPRKRRIPT